MKIIRWGLLLLGLSLSGTAVASPIFYETVDEGGGRWTYNYTAGNDTAFDIEEFTIYFDYGLYEFVLVDDGFGGQEVDPNDYDAPADWDPIVAPTDIILGVEEDGFYDAFAFGDLLFPGNLIPGFSVSFTYLGLGTPGSQFFEYFGYDAADNDIFGDSFTELRDDTPQPVPEPGTLLLMSLGLLGFFVRRVLPIR